MSGSWPLGWSWRLSCCPICCRNRRPMDGTPGRAGDDSERAPVLVFDGGALAAVDDSHVRTRQPSGQCDGASVSRIVARPLPLPSLRIPAALACRRAAMPVVVLVSGAFFNLINGYINGRWLFALSGPRPLAWLASLRFVAGCVLFAVGLCTHIIADRSLRRLRSNGEYAVPRGPIFRLVSCPTTSAKSSNGRAGRSPPGRRPASCSRCGPRPT